MAVRDHSSPSGTRKIERRAGRIHHTVALSRRTRVPDDRYSVDASEIVAKLIPRRQVPDELASALHFVVLTTRLKKHVGQLRIRLKGAEMRSCQENRSPDVLSGRWIECA